MVQKALVRLGHVEIFLSLLFFSHLLCEWASAGWGGEGGGGTSNGFKRTFKSFPEAT